MRPAVSVIIPTHNYAHYLPFTLQNILSRQDVPLEVVVVDDGSSDDTAEAVRPFAGSVRYIRQENRGPSAARNTGLAHAKGDFVVFLDADDLVYPGTLASQFRALRSSPHADGAVCSSETFTSGEPGGRYVPDGVSPLVSGDFSVHLCGKNIAPIHAFCVSRKIIATVGGFDETQRCLEDYDFWLRCAAAGCAFVRNPEGIALYRRHAESSSAGLGQTNEFECAMRRRVHSLLEKNSAFPTGQRAEAWLAHSVRCFELALDYAKAEGAAKREMFDLGRQAVDCAAADTRAVGDEKLVFFFAVRAFIYLKQLAEYMPDESGQARRDLVRVSPGLTQPPAVLKQQYDEAASCVYGPTRYVTNFETWETAWKS